MGIRAIIPQTKKQETIVFLTSLFSNEDKLILAPLQNLTNLFFRKTFAKFFPTYINYAISPFISASAGQENSYLLKQTKLPIQYQDVSPKENKNIIAVIPQILGHDADKILKCAKILEHLGYREININMGCPKKDIVSHKSGAGLLKEKELVRQIIENILNNTSLQLSLKVRLGINDSIDLENLVPILNTYPLKSITIHSRTQAQQYEGQVNLTAFEKFAKELKHTIIYNGDIFSVSDFTKLKTKFPYIKHWMLGRGLLKNPFLAAQIKGIPYDKTTILLPYLNELQYNFTQSLRHYNEKTILNKMKEFTKYLSEGYNFDATNLLRETSLKDFEKQFTATINSLT